MSRPVLPPAGVPARLGVNLDHIATLRQLRGTPYPDLLEAVGLVQAGGGEQITIHLREDRRHIQDADVKWLAEARLLPLNLEMAASEAMAKLAVRVRPDWVCLVPEKRQEVTTEGGLELVKARKRIDAVIRKLKKAGIKVSLFVEPTRAAMKASFELGADAVELHTGRFCLATQAGESHRGGARKNENRLESPAAKRELARIVSAAEEAKKLGIHCHAGHGLDYLNVRALTEITDESGRELIEEYNIGHAIVCRAALVGMERAVREMVAAIQAP